MQTFPIKNLVTGEVLELSIDEWIKIKTTTISQVEATNIHKAGDKKFIFIYQQQTQVPQTNHTTATYNSSPKSQQKVGKKCNCL